MKLSLLFSAFFLLSSITTLAAAEAVLDTDGNELKRQVRYYIQPGLTLEGRSDSCPRDVALAVSPIDTNGLPLTFIPANPEEETINTATDLNIDFSVATTCFQSTFWTLRFDGATGRWYVTTGGVEGNPGRGTLGSWFKIESDRGAYRLVCCPSVCETCRPSSCGPLGLYNEDGRQWLGVNFDAPLQVEFRVVQISS